SQRLLRCNERGFVPAAAWIYRTRREFRSPLRAKAPASALRFAQGKKAAATNAKRRQPSLERRSRTLSLNALPSIVFPVRISFAALTTAPICLTEAAFVSAMALATAV